MNSNITFINVKENINLNDSQSFNRKIFYIEVNGEKKEIIKKIKDIFEVYK